MRVVIVDLPITIADKNDHAMLHRKAMMVASDWIRSRLREQVMDWKNPKKPLAGPSALVSP